MTAAASGARLETSSLPRSHREADMSATFTTIHDLFPLTSNTFFFCSSSFKISPVFCFLSIPVLFTFLITLVSYGFLWIRETFVWEGRTRKKYIMHAVHCCFFYYAHMIFPWSIVCDMDLLCILFVLLSQKSGIHTA